MFGKMGDMGGMLKKAYEMKNQMGKIKEELDGIEVKGLCEDLVEVTATCSMKVKSIKISPELVNTGDTEKVEDMVMTAVNSAMDEAKKISQKKMSDLTGGLGLNIPGLFG